MFFFNMQFSTSSVVATGLDSIYKMCLTPGEVPAQFGLDPCTRKEGRKVQKCDYFTFEFPAISQVQGQ